ncbi:unnamed protein product [Rotaria socialis]|uniref:F-box domain-containing protein n=1 Tax=Rotaria socialis TaxID=392032 RepID=A0A818F7J4_9BILA|nr:unnamed protein product [Rotaria socialis]CAF3334997.1 unnamed protein product [Rotaria socialis]CAF3470626.1 unnamed protein product [Rotaria socialis]CAF3494539.1 unnamed protein product [Rotaria socialis]CAF4109684.1 unnamed protein product [Rotaria socialis]
MARLFDFPDELLCKILEYLSSYDALYSFFNLNIRFNRLLMPFKHQIDLTYLSYGQFMNFIKIILPTINKDEPLYSLKLGNVRTPGQIDLFNTLIYDQTYRDYFDNINKIIIECPRLNELIIFVENFLLSLSNLASLSIKIDHIRDEDFHKWTQLIVNSVLSISNLVKLEIEMPTGLVLSRVCNTTMFNSLVDLSLSLTLVTDLLILIQHTPNLEKLSIRIGWWTSGDRTLLKMLDEMRLNTDRISFLIHLKKFHLTIDSILTFQFEHLEQVLYRILNNEITDSFSFIIQNCLNHNSELTQLIDGQRWESLLSAYSSLNQFNLFIRITGCLQANEEIYNINSFKSKYFLKKQWSFSYFKYAPKENIIFYSIPYKSKELFDISINNHEIFNSFPINYASNLLIDQTKNENYRFNESTFDIILKKFPSLQELRLIHFKSDLSIINPISIPLLHTLKVEKEQNVNLSKLLELLPLTNTLFISFLSIYDRNKPLDICQYNRIRELSLIDVPANDMNPFLLFLNQFPNLHILHIHIYNQRMPDECLLSILNKITRTFPSIIYLKLQLERDIDLSIDWKQQCNGLVKMYLKSIIFVGILVHLWF